MWPAFTVTLWSMQVSVGWVARYRRETHVTPKSYLSFINGYKDIYRQKYAHFGDLAERMNTGLAKLIEATHSVDVLSKDLVVKEQELAVANKKADSVSVALFSMRNPLLPPFQNFMHGSCMVSHGELGRKGLQGDWFRVMEIASMQDNIKESLQLVFCVPINLLKDQGHVVVLELVPVHYSVTHLYMQMLTNCL